jgi:hypothetical protein
MTDPDSKSLDVLGLKPVSDSINRVTRAAVDGASAFLSRICLPAAEELGLLFRDKVANWRARNAVAIVEAAREKLDSLDASDRSLAHPRIVGEIIDSGSWADSDDTQEMWAGLLASSCTSDGRDDSNLIFANLLKQITSLEAKVLRYSCETSTKTVTSAGWLTAEDLKVSEQELVEITGESDLHRIDRELDHLRSLELIDGGFNTDSRVADITPTALALQLYMRCKGHRGDPLVYYELRSDLNAEDSAKPRATRPKTSASSDARRRRGRKNASKAAPDDP